MKLEFWTILLLLILQGIHFAWITYSLFFMKEELNWDEEKVNMVVSKIAGVSGVLIFIFITYIFVISQSKL